MSSRRQTLDQNDSENADQVEYRALTLSSATLTTSYEDEAIAGVLEDDNIGDPFQNQDLAQDDYYERTLNVIQRRVKILGNSYPFELSNDKQSLSFRSNTNPVYEFCLITALHFRGELWASALFEEVAMIAASRILPSIGRFHRTGWPRSSSDAPTNAEDMFKHIHQLSGEWNWRPYSDLPPHAKRFKDLKLDFVVWGDLGDERSTNLWFVGQCACGNNWPEKTTELNLGELRNWVEVPRIPPVRAFVIPFDLVDDVEFKTKTSACGLFLDRLRVSILLRDYDWSTTEGRALLKQMEDTSTKFRGVGLAQ